MNRYNYKQRKSLFRRFKDLFYTVTGNNGVFGPGYQVYYRFDYGKVAIALSIVFFVIIVSLILILL